jgi:HPt (histidine-containing phosphotransfer) domain-containing protein
MDCKHGDDAAHRQDLSGLYTVAHTLSAALEMLGEKDLSNQCRTLMDLTKKTGDVEQATRAWTILSENLMALSKRLRLKSLQ